MKVTIFISSLEGGGAERVVCNLSNYLLENGENVNIVIFKPGDIKYDLNKNVKVHSLVSAQDFNNNTIKKYHLLYRELKKFIKQNKTDCYLVFTETPILLLLLLKSIIKVPVIISERNDPDSYIKPIKILLKILLRRSDGYVFQTDTVKSWYKKYTKKKQMWVIPNAINDEFINQKNDDIKVKKIVAVGRLETQKNYPMLLKAFSMIDKKYDEYKLEIYGIGPLEAEIKNMIVELGIEQRVILHGFSKSIQKEIKNASLFVMTSTHEGMPNALIEAMALGLPCVVTDCAGGGPRYLINDGINGFLFPVDDVKLLKTRIEMVLSDPILAKTLSTNAIKIQDRLNPKKIYKQWHEVLKSIYIEN